jgi:hypothetical protein
MYIAIDCFSFPEDFDPQVIEQAITAYGDHILFAGRLLQDPNRRFTHAIIWKFEDFDDYNANNEGLLAMLNEDGSNMAELWGGYKADHWWGCKVVDLKDPVLVEHGPQEWSRRELQPMIDLAKKDKRMAGWVNFLAWWAMDAGDRPHRVAEFWLREQASLPFKE